MTFSRTLPTMKNLYSSKESDEYFFIEGCHILELFNTEADSSISIARARVEPGVETRLHRLESIDERYLIQSGQGLATIGDQPSFTVKKNDVVTIKANTPQKIKNVGNDDLIFLAICTPRFTAEAYHDCDIN